MTRNNTPATALEVQDIAIVFEKRPILQNFDLQVAQGEKVVLAGPSGCGKSTLLKCLLGFVLPHKGRIQINGQKLDHDSVWEIRRQIAYVTQEPEFAPGTVEAALQLPFTYKANSALRDNLDRIPELLTCCNLPITLLAKDIKTLSGGEKQRIALISAILLDRPIILLDEVTSALDKENKAAVAHFFQEAYDKTVLSIAHDTNWHDSADRVIHLPANDSLEGATL
ncbi:MAG: ATP-binding cassette domain-containing protein [Kiritimatiellia bacterium]